MRLFRWYRSNKYLLRISLAVSILALLLLTVFSVVIFYSSENIILNMQQNYEKKVLAQMNYNLTYMNKNARDLGWSLYFDNDLIPLIIGTEMDNYEIFRKKAKMDTFAKYTPFLHSIVIYNSKIDKFLWGGDSSLQDQQLSYYTHMRGILQGTEDGAADETSVLGSHHQMLPMSLKGDGNIDVFSMIFCEGQSCNEGQSALILNLNTNWLFENIQVMNFLSENENERIIVMDGQGSVVSSNQQVPMNQDLKTAIKRYAQAAGNEPSSFSFGAGSEKKIVNFLNTSINGWQIVSVQPYENVVRKINEVKRLFIALTLVFLTLALIAAVMISRRIYRPVGALFNIVKRDAGAGADDQATDEFSYISGKYRDTAEQLDRMKRERMHTRDIVRNYYLSKLIAESSTIHSKDFLDIIRTQRFNIRTTGSYMLAVAQMDAGQDREEVTAQVRKLLHFAISNITQEYISKVYDCESAEMKTDHCVFIISVTEDRTEEIYTRLAGEFQKAQKTIYQFYKAQFSVSLSGRIDGFREFNSQYQSTLHNVHYKLIYGPQTIIYPETVDDNLHRTDAHLPEELARLLAESIKSNDRTMYENTLDKILERVSTLNYNYVMHMLLYTAVLVRGTVYEINKRRIIPNPVDCSPLMNAITAEKPLLSIRAHFLEVFQGIHALEHPSESQRSHVLIEAIKEIIEVNHANPNLCLQEVGDMMKMSPEYVGKLFRKNNEISVAEYIHEVRLQHAVDCLENSSDTIDEIIEKCGFTNRGNFFRLFKKKYGTTPREYRVKQVISEYKDIVE